MEHLIPSLSPADNTSQIQSLDQLFGLLTCSLLYFSAGSGRGTDMLSLPEFASMKVVFNSLQFTMRHKKGETHGRSNNKPVEHYVPPSLTRCVLVLYLCIYPLLDKQQDNGIPDIDVQVNTAEASNAALITFKDIMNVANFDSVGFRDARHIVSQIGNYWTNCQATPKESLTTTPEMARQFHHTPSMHGTHYCSNTFRRDQYGSLVGTTMLVVRDFWDSFGEQHCCFSNVNLLVGNTIPSIAYTKALQRGLGPNVNCKPFQVKAFTAIDDFSSSAVKHVFVFIRPGDGKSTLWNVPPLARYMHGYKPFKFMVVIPHNALLAQQQHSTQEKYFCSTSLKVIYINSKNMRNYTETASDFDLCYISIHAFDILIKLHRAKLQSWNINVIFIDECHLLFAENFRLGKQWSSLYNLVSLGPRIVCTSATFCPTSIKSTATFLGMSIDNYQVIGGAADYIPPNVAIQTKTSNDNALITEVSDYIQHRINHNPLHEKFALYVIAMTKDRAVDLSNQLSGIDISSTSLTSDDTEILRTQKMNEWEKGNLKVLVSTFNCGLDCPYVKEVIFLGGCRAVVDAVQGMGRIRPHMQNGAESLVTFWFTNLSWANVRDDEKFESQMTKWKDNHLLDWLQSEEDQCKAQKELKFLFNIAGLQCVFRPSNKKCIRRCLMLAVGVRSDDCKLCDHCLNSNPINNAEMLAAEERHRQEVNAKKKVLSVVSSLADKCYVCDKSTCDGKGCLGQIKPCITPTHNFCYACFGYTGNISGFHKRDKCCANQFDCQNVACPHCFMCIDNSIFDRGTLEEHSRNKCKYQSRVKRILYYNVTGSTDCGISAKKMLDAALSSSKLWMETMSINIDKINSDKCK